MSATTKDKQRSATPAITGRGRIEAIGDRLIMRLPAQASLELPSRGQVAVEAMVDGHAFTAVLEPDGRKGHWLAVGEPLGATAGEVLEFRVRVAAAWPEPEVPEDLRDALDAAPETSGPWQDITPMARWEWVRWIAATRSPQTRARRVAVTVSKLSAGKRRPCCFDLSSCTDPEVARSGKLVETG
ncbi:hypothetical protein BJF85_24435 [Saccharomonospora sp. CUA-673]|uniref:YdeI/OmpD-associated family protein n=1 Tax=Saccharomonospora sp. CUA-673 TaxID=1904969 RepID=UPI000967E41B|nr:YdeI/OmpD-associated family protein [Saccharomonospora sp. CUA-673]OLT41175.1 hypothetical protein BJF85_24435 [Saccharomonospora sp. CUA-673]